MNMYIYIYVHTHVCICLFEANKKKLRVWQMDYVNDRFRGRFTIHVAVHCFKGTAKKQ